MTDLDFEQTISAAWDGEPVDLDTLRSALQTTEGRQALASYALIRASAAAEDIEPRGDLAARLRASVATPRRWWFVAGPAVPARLAASLAAVAVAAALWLGVAWRSQVPAPSGAAPVAATTAGRGLPAGASEQTVPTSAGDQARGSERQSPVGSRPRSNVLTETPPTPTRTIRLVEVDSGS
jgi:negative regulator of sigma E activity